MSLGETRELKSRIGNLATELRVHRIHDSLEHKIIQRPSKPCGPSEMGRRNYILRDSFGNAAFGIEKAASSHFCWIPLEGRVFECCPFKKHVFTTSGRKSEFRCFSRADSLRKPHLAIPVGFPLRKLRFAISARLPLRKHNLDISAGIPLRKHNLRLSVGFSLRKLYLATSAGFPMRKHNLAISVEFSLRKHSLATSFGFPLRRQYLFTSVGLPLRKQCVATSVGYPLRKAC